VLQHAGYNCRSKWRLRAGKRNDVSIRVSDTVLSGRRKTGAERNVRTVAVELYGPELSAAAAMSVRHHDLLFVSIQSRWTSTALPLGHDSRRKRRLRIDHRNDVPVGHSDTVLSGRRNTTARWKVRSVSGRKLSAGKPMPLRLHDVLFAVESTLRGHRLPVRHDGRS
jgi:hypothetical protein